MVKATGKWFTLAVAMHLIVEDGNMVMEKAGFLDRIGRENVCPHVEAALVRAREILGLPPAPPVDPLHEEKKKLEAVP